MKAVTYLNTDVSRCFVALWLRTLASAILRALSALLRPAVTDMSCWTGRNWGFVGASADAVVEAEVAGAFVLPNKEFF
jgi:hypothetical protein